MFVSAYRAFTSTDSSDAQFEFSQTYQIVQFATAPDANLKFITHGAQYQKIDIDLLSGGASTIVTDGSDRFSTTEHALWM